MPFTFDNFVVQTYTGINDNPIAPNATRGGNGSHLVSKHNGLLSHTQAIVNILDDKVKKAASWIPISANSGSYTSTLGENIITYSYGTLLFHLPEFSTLVPSDSVGILITDPRTNLQISPTSVMGQSATSISLDTSKCLGEPVYFVFLNESYGWLCSKANTLNINGIPYNFNPYG